MSGPSRLRYQPALDGVRALAVLAVLMFHAGVPGFDGGYLGVSVFFTLSGYLITSLLVTEFDQSDRIDLRAFYGRRLRRLLPASVLTVTGVVVASAATDVFDGVASLRDHVVGAVLQIANWVFLVGDGSYQDLLAQTSGTPSPLEHFWSLAIEEQFYWVWPLAMVLLLPRVRDRPGRMRVIGVLAAITMVAAPVIAQVWGPDAAYWATPARLGEILVGAFVAVAMVRRTPSPTWSWMAPVGLSALAIAIVLFPSGSGPAYEGALPLVAVMSGLLLVGLQVDGPLRDALSAGPLVGLGRISYGIYLFHWPLYVVLDADRTGLGEPWLTVVRLTATLVVALLSYRFVEQPIRTARRITFTPTLMASGLATAAVVVAAFVLVPAALGDYWRVDGSLADAVAIRIDDTPLAVAPRFAPGSGDEPTATSIGAASDTTTDTSTDTSTVVPISPSTDAAPDRAVPTATTAIPTTSTAATPAPLPDLGRPVRIVVTGDSTAEALGTGVVSWAAAHPGIAQTHVQAAPGCGFVEGGERRHGDGAESVASCDGWVDQQLLPVIDRTRPDVVVVMMTTWDVVDRRWDDGALLAPTVPEYRDRIASAYGRLVDRLLFAGAGHVVFVREPVPDVWWLPIENDEDQPQRHEVLYETYDALAATHPGTVSVVPFDRWFTQQGFDRDQAIRPDGVHLDPAAAELVTTDYLGDGFVRAALGMPIS